MCLEGKTHDDVSNILQQWRNNSCIPAQPKETTEISEAPPVFDQAMRLNSRTFTRPKRRICNNTETLFMNPAAMASTSSLDHDSLRPTPSPSKFNLNLEIGGLVGGHQLPMHKSFLQDTSPPSSIASSMDASMDRFNSSLVTSADFSNVSNNFLQSATAHLGGDLSCFNLADKATSDGYTLNDLISDRKALESLTLSGEGTLIKDSHIAQIDDISLAFSKTASGCSTMDNSTESVGVEAHNRTAILNSANQNRTYVGVSGSGDCGVPELNHTTVLGGGPIRDSTFSLPDNHVCLEGGEQPPKKLNLVRDVMLALLTPDDPPRETLQEALALNETVWLSDYKGNATFECVPQQPATPENVAKQFYESTPQAASARSRAKHHRQYTPHLDSADVVNISPIIPVPGQQKATRLFDETFEKEETASVAAEAAAQKSRRIRRTSGGKASDTFVGVLTQLESLELLENVPDPNKTYEAPARNTYGPSDHSAADAAEMQNVMNMAQAEADLLAGNGDEDEFDHMLAKVSRVELNEEQVKMKKSLDEIKKRFSCALGGVVSTEISREARDMRELMRSSDEVSGYDVGVGIGGGLEAKNDEIRRLRQQLASRGDGWTSGLANAELKTSMLSSKEFGRDLREGLTSSTLSNAGGGGSGERLLMRRSRLYDDVNLSNLSIASKASYTIARHGDTPPAGAYYADPSEYKTERDDNERKDQHGTCDDAALASDAKDAQTSRPKMLERRQRDRDRFKTIKVHKTTVMQNDGTIIELNLPNIDDDDCVVYDEPAPVFNNNKSEVDVNAKQQETTTNNCLTYRKPRETKFEDTTQTAVQPPILHAEQRSLLARPRYISGLQKFSTAAAGTSNAASAEELSSVPDVDMELGRGNNANLNATGAAVSGAERKAQRFNRTEPGAGRAKSKANDAPSSPMGVKSKSHGNLSGNFGYMGMTGLQPPRLSVYGLKKPTAYGGNSVVAKPVKVQTQQQHQQKHPPQQQQEPHKEEAVFKVPKLVSGIRAPSGGTRLARPSSGYYSLSSAATGNKYAGGDQQTDAERCSPTDSISSASSRGSDHNGPIIGHGNNLRVPIPMNSAAPIAGPGTRHFTGHSGIPKPSGLRQPTVINRSCLRGPNANVNNGRQ